LIVAANEMFNAVSERSEREEAHRAWKSLGRIVHFLAHQQGFDPDEFGADRLHSGVHEIPSGLAAGVWIDRVLRLGGRIILEKDGAISFALRPVDPAKMKDALLLEAQFAQLDMANLRETLISDIEYNVYRPYNLNHPSAEGRDWLVSRPRNSITTLHAIEIPAGDVA
jgi:hypothetical protein